MLHFSEAKLALDAYLLENFGRFENDGGTNEQDELWLSEVLIYIDEKHKARKEESPEPSGFAAIE